MSDNGKLIEEARAEAEATKNSTYTNAPLLFRLADALEAAEEAHTPTDNEREALLAIFAEPVIASTDEEVREAFADMVLAAGFHRSETPEPSAEFSICGCYRDGSELVTCALHTEPQGEPSDAQVQAALDAYHDAKVAPGWRGEKTWKMRAALRAAGVVR